MGGEVGDLDEHGGDQVDALQQLQVDVHVEGHLPGLLDLLLLGGPEDPLVLPLREEALRDQLLAPPAQLDVQQRVVRVLGEGEGEGELQG